MELDAFAGNLTCEKLLPINRERIYVISIWPFNASILLIFFFTSSNCRFNRRLIKFLMNPFRYCNVSFLKILMVETNGVSLYLFRYDLQWMVKQSVRTLKSFYVGRGVRFTQNDILLKRNMVCYSQFVFTYCNERTWYEVMNIYDLHQPIINSSKIINLIMRY